MVTNKVWWVLLEGRKGNFFFYKGEGRGRKGVDEVEDTVRGGKKGSGVPGNGRSLKYS